MIINGKKLYTVVDANTGEATYYEETKVFLDHPKYGTMKPGEDFVPFKIRTDGRL